MDSRRGFVAGFTLVLASMIVLFEVPRAWFIPATFVATSCMLIGSHLSGVRWRLKWPPTGVLLVGVASAAILYLIFLAGGYWVREFHPFGIGGADVSSIYSLIASPSNPVYLQVAVLVFDSAGYESFFRGALQARMKPRLGVGSAPAAAAVDAAIHILTLNPLWVATTFVVDLVWGLSFHYSQRLAAPFTSHLLWDLAVFIFFPIR